MLKKYNDPAERLSLLQVFGITQADIGAIHQMHIEIILPNAEKIVDSFYQKLLKQDKYRPFFSDPEQTKQLKKKQLALLLEMGVDCLSPVYFEDRLQIGKTYANLGMPLNLCQASYNLLHDAIISHIPEALMQKPAKFSQYVRTLFSIISLDMNLATEAYHFNELNKIKHQLSELQNTSNDIKEEANIDPLTKLYNRNYVVNNLQKLIREQNSENPIIVIMADIDHFKQVNDKHGHLVGDIVLKDVAFRIRSTMRSFDFVGRYGGEEFIIVLQNSDIHEGYEVAERLRQRIADVPVQHEGHRHNVTISMGLSQITSGDTVANAIQRADQALYQAKNNGRNRVQAASQQPPLQAQASNRLELIKSSLL